MVGAPTLAHTIVLVAHGAHDDRSGLTPHGQRQAQVAVDGLQRLDITADVVLTSPRPYAVATAQYIIDRFRCPSTTLAELSNAASPPTIGAFYDILDEYEAKRDR